MQSILVFSPIVNYNDVQVGGYDRSMYGEMV